MKKIILSFILGSSVVSTFITFLYLGIGVERADNPDILGYSFFPILIPLMYGGFNVFNVVMSDRFGMGENFACVSGALLGLSLSYLGRFVFKLPEKVFKMKKQDEWLVHVLAAVMYCLIFRLIIQNLNDYLL